ncbi:MAG: hypothetical protein SNJ72_11235 [Fimbriimonadales bacterium]
MRSTLVALGLAGSIALSGSIAAYAKDDLSVSTVTIPTSMVRIQKLMPVDQFIPAGSQPAPYIYLSSLYSMNGPSGLTSFSFFGPTDLATVEYADDAILGGIQPLLPVAHPNSAACLREIQLGIYAASASLGEITVRFRVYGWDGNVAATAQYPDPLNVVGNANLIWDSGDLNYGAIPAAGIYLLTTAVPGVVVSKAIYVSFTISGLPSNSGVLIAHSSPGNVYLTPSRGDFRRKTPSGRFGFTTAVQGSFYMNLRGTHNFVGELDLSALNDRAKPKDPAEANFDGDNDGSEDALRRNMVDVEYNFTFTPLTGSPSSFTTRFTTYLDDNGRFTIPAGDTTLTSGTITLDAITVRRWDNGLAVTFNRPTGGWSTDVCNPSVDSAQVTFGDVNGDGIIDDADLLAVLFGFGSSE